MGRRGFRRVVPTLAAAQLGAVLVSAAAASEPIDFGLDVQPILAEHCYECHGPGEREGGLRLSNRADAFTPGDFGIPVISPGSADHSLLFELITSDDPQERMPHERDPLSPEQIATIETWITEGAAWPDGAQHWAYDPPSRPDLPTVSDERWPNNAIDYFVLARLEQAGLQPAPEADRRTLLRRVYLDLVGLPPTPHDMNAFLADDSPGAFERVVDGLLASPRFGERWTSQWLDLARYADSTGFMSEVALPNWPYRDWVIDAINDDMPFDRFTVEQLAGDLLPAPTLDQRIATGFLRAAPLNLEAGVREEDARVYQVIDRVNTMGSVWLGSTIECAQCHDHKYDPISQEEYYRLLSYFNSTTKETTATGENGVFLVADGPRIELPHHPTTSETAAREAHRLLDDLQAALDRSLSDAEPITPEERRRIERAARALDWQTALSQASTLVTTRLAAEYGPSWWRPWSYWWSPWLEHSRALIDAGEPAWKAMEIVSFEQRDPSGSVVEEDYRILDDGSVLLSTLPSSQTVYVVEARVQPGAITGFRLDVLRHEELPGGGPGRLNPDKPEFAVHELLAFDGDDAIPLISGPASGRQPGWLPSEAFDGNADTGWRVGASALEQDNWLVFLPTVPVDQQDADVIRFEIHQNLPFGRIAGRIRLQATSAPQDIVEMPPSLRARLLSADWDDLEPMERFVLLTFARRHRFPEGNPAMDRARLVAARTPDTPVAHVIEEEDIARQTNVFERGDHRNPGKPVEPGGVSVLHAMRPDSANNRLGLAQWLTDTANPLLGRVVVNRWWAHLLGRGIVPTLEDFGSRGGRPTHPALLDWLAVEFTSSWSRKTILKEIVTSATYRQAALPADPSVLERDPANQLFGRNPRRRLPAETIRDNTLLIAGLLVEETGGPEVYPPQPPGIWRSNGHTDAKYEPSTGADRFRRGVYTVWRRTAPYPSFAVFDAGNRTACTVSRSLSNTPLQALTLLNDEVYSHAALAFAERILREQPDGTPEDRIAHAFEIALARPPTTAELATLTEFRAARSAALQADPHRVELLVRHTEASTDDVQPQELASWFYVARVILNLDETITRG